MKKDKIEIHDTTPIVKTDTFVNDDYRGAVLTNLGCYVKSKNA